MSHWLHRAYFRAHAVRVVGDRRGPVREHAEDADIPREHIEYPHQISFAMNR
jgi:hypothetical protein